MNRAPDAVAYPVADHAEAGILGDFLYSISDIAEMDAWTARRNARLEARLRHVDEPQHLGVGDAERDGAGSVAVEAVLLDADVCLDEIARHDDAVAVGDAVDDLVVQRDAEMPGEVGRIAPAGILEEARADVVLSAVLDDEIVDLASRDAGRDGRGADVAYFRAHPARLAHLRELGLRLDVDFHCVTSPRGTPLRSSRGPGRRRCA